MNKHWFRADIYHQGVLTRSAHQYVWASCETQARDQILTNPFSTTEVVLHCVEDKEVPDTLRVLTEVTTEQLRSELKKRGWNLSLT